MDQALLKRPDNVARVQKMRAEIARIGGRMEISPPTSSGMTEVVVWLPPGVEPKDFFSDLPFYPV